MLEGSDLQSKSKLKENSYEDNTWTYKVTESHILQGIGDERVQFESEMYIPGLPEMIFDKNCLRIINRKDPQTWIEFNARDALKLVQNSAIDLKLPVSEAWRQSREASVSNMEVFHPFDWTFTTPYSGSLHGNWQVKACHEELDIEMLRKVEQLLFYSEVPLFEDELGDNGLSELHVKIRTMPSGFFVLMRFFLRVDGSILRAFDTRLHYVSGRNYIFRECKHLESSAWSTEFERVPMWLVEPAKLTKEVLNQAHRLYFE